MSISRLPFELCRIILQQVTRIRDLYSCLLVSKTFSGEAMALLYYNIHLPYPHTRREMRLINHLASSPQTSSLVRTFGIPRLRLNADFYVQYWETVHRALKNMTHLQNLRIKNELEFLNNPYITQPEFTSLLDGCTFRLRSLAFHSKQFHDSNIIDAQAPDLEELIIVSLKQYRPSGKVRFDKVRTLGSYDCGLLALLAVMPNVTAIEWRVGDSFEYGKYLKPFEGVRMLCIHDNGAYYAPPDILRSIVACFSSLVYLKCVIMEGPTKFSVDQFLSIPSYVNTLNSLKKLYIEMGNQTYQIDMIGSYDPLFQHFPALGAIEMHFDDRHVRLFKGIGGITEEIEVVPNLDEWKSEIWLGAN